MVHRRGVRCRGRDRRRAGRTDQPLQAGCGDCLHTVGRGGPGYQFEIETPPDGLRYDPYVVAMANNGSTQGSQFFIGLVDLDEALRRVGTYTIFGRVASGTELIDEIATVPVNDPRIGLPLTPVVIVWRTVAPNWLTDSDRIPIPAALSSRPASAGAVGELARISVMCKR